MVNTYCTTDVPRSLLFTFFNKARAHKAGLNRDRVNRALGIIQAGKIVLLEDGTAIVQGSAEPVYYVNRDGCDCPDHLWRGITCKHQIARWLLIRIVQHTPDSGSELELVEPEGEEIEDLISNLWGGA